MKQTIYSCKVVKEGKTYWYGDKLLRIAFIIFHTIELALIVYLVLQI